jgi:hypothetical protein
MDPASVIDPGKCVTATRFVGDIVGVLRPDVTAAQIIAVLIWWFMTNTKAFTFGCPNMQFIKWAHPLDYRLT